MTKLLLIAGLISIAFSTSSWAAAVGSDGPPPIKKGKFEYSTYTQSQPCFAKASPVCFLDTFAIARSIDNGELVWERRVYFVEYKAEAGPKLKVPVTAMKFSGAQALELKNQKGDTFTLELKHGHLKKPKDAKKYTSK